MTSPFLVAQLALLVRRVQLEPMVQMELQVQQVRMALRQLSLLAPCLRVLLVLALRLQTAVLRQQLFLTLQFPVVLLARQVLRALTVVMELMEQTARMVRMVQPQRLQLAR